MIAQAIATVLMLIVFMFGFTYFLNSLFFRRIEKHDHEQTKKTRTSRPPLVLMLASVRIMLKIGLPVKVKGSQLRPVGKEVV